MRRCGNGRIDTTKCSRCGAHLCRCRSKCDRVEASTQFSPRDAHERLPEIAAFQHADEGRRRVFETVGDVLAIADAPIGDGGRDGSQESGIVLRGEFVVDEAAQGEALAQRRRL